MSLQEILDKIIEDPLTVTFEEKTELLTSDLDLFNSLRKLIHRIFDINERTLLEQSDATIGIMGKLNRRSTKKRIARYYRIIKNPSFDRTKEGNKVIVAEGDSWFQYPNFVRDIIDWLILRNPRYAIYCIAYGGDWMTNMIYDGKYIEELSVHAPDVFLLSGGGNDLVGSNRIAIMVDRNTECKKYASEQDIPNFPDPDGYQLTNVDRKEILQAQSFIRKEFYSFLLVLELQYRKILGSIQKKYPNMLTITQGYDFAIPSYSRTFNLRYPMQFFLNWFMNGKWLVQPLRIKGVYDAADQKAIIKTMIYELNFMMSGMALSKQYPNLYHVNAVGTATSKRDWFDELHLKSHVYKKVAMTYEKVIQMHFSEKGKRPAEKAADKIQQTQ